MNNFSENTVNQRFKEVFITLQKNEKIKSKSDIASQLGTYNHIINSILKGERNITVDQMNKLFETYSVNANYLFGISNDMFTDDAGVSGDLQTLTHGFNFSGRQNITLVPNKALAGYALNAGDQHFMENLQRFSIPGLDGALTAFEISGDSMVPTITNGDIVVCEPIERNEPLRDNQVYVVVTDVVVAKRIQQIKQGTKVTQLRLISDNSDVYRPYTVELNEVQQILRVKCRLTSYAIA
jgi:phage repressor protein C with HTH and peptisase S24 domain